MRCNRLTTVVLGILVVGLAVAPAGVAGQPDAVGECMNADRGPGDGGPPGFVPDLVPNSISGLVGELPAPNFVKRFFGARTC